jgi:hypothetical protein
MTGLYRAIRASSFFLSMFIGLSPAAMAKEEGAISKSFWSGYEKTYTKDCLSASDEMMQEVMPAICACGLDKIKANHSIKDLMFNKVADETYESYGLECTYEVFDKPGPYPAGVRNAIYQNCAAEPELGEYAEPYCSCYVGKLEAEFTFTQMMKGELADADYERLADVCIADLADE